MPANAVGAAAVSWRPVEMIEDHAGGLSTLFVLASSCGVRCFDTFYRSLDKLVSLVLNREAEHP